MLSGLFSGKYYAAVFHKKKHIQTNKEIVADKESEEKKTEVKPGKRIEKFSGHPFIHPCYQWRTVKFT